MKVRKLDHPLVLEAEGESTTSSNPLPHYPDHHRLKDAEDHSMIVSNRELPSSRPGSSSEP
jgi:hypothetical protein